MVRTQIQLPDHLYRQVKQLADEQEISLAEMCRRGLERIIESYPPGRGKVGGWELPLPVDLNLIKDPFADPNWREEVNLSQGALCIISGTDMQTRPEKKG